MRINSIKINNFSSYSGECFFDFTLSDGKSIILIGGQNGTGKTSLFTALKLALYGHLSFNYQSANGQYMAKVKELINHDAFTLSEVKAFIEIEIQLPNEREYVKYIIRREWEYTANRLFETMSVFQDGDKLSENQILFFQNYLYTILPPNLFDFYFFDGEQIADFFATSNYNTYIKNAILTLCNYDTFEIIRKFCNGYVSNSDIEEDNNSVASSYEAVVDKINTLKTEQISLEQEILSLESVIASVLTKKNELENEFKNSGGLTESEKDELLKTSRELENKKGEHSIAIRSFVEGKMPFIIASSIVPEITKQLEKEDEVKKYLVLNDKLSSPEIAKAVAKTMKDNNISVADKIVKEITKAIGNAVKPDLDIDTFIFLHDLSKDQRERVNSILTFVKEFKTATVLKRISEREKATQKTMAINKQLREAMTDTDAEAFSLKLTELTNKQFELQSQYDNSIKVRETNINTLEELEKEQKVLFEKLKENAKSRNVYELTQKIRNSLNNMIQTLTATKFKQIEAEILVMLKKILRKDNFIDLVELDENFNISIYKEQTYQICELENLIRNIGQDELVKRIGVAGTTRILQIFSIDSIAKLRANLKKSEAQMQILSETPIKLYKRIELGQLSKGEKQIFILSLYFAIIKVSGKDIPFIIDTPYARIDTEHREQISREFFPNISNQIIILSTDEEITKPYYDVLKPYIAKEYLLEYNEQQSKTMVVDGYFF